MITLVAMQSFAANVDRMTAQSKAEAFLKTNAARGKMMAPASIQFVSQRTITNSANVNMAVMYVFNTADRFVIVSGEDRAMDILAVGDAPIDFNNIPSNMQVWLDYYQRQIEFLQAHPGLEVEKPKAPSRAKTVAPLACFEVGPAGTLLESVCHQRYAVPDRLPCHRTGSGVLLLEIPDC